MTIDDPYATEVEAKADIDAAIRDIVDPRGITKAAHSDVLNRLVDTIFQAISDSLAGIRPTLDEMVDLLFVEGSDPVGAERFVKSTGLYWIRGTSVYAAREPLNSAASEGDDFTNEGMPTEPVASQRHWQRTKQRMFTFDGSIWT